MSKFRGQQIGPDLELSGSVSASTYYGDGSNLQNVIASAAPAGPDESVQFRDGGTTSGSSAFTFDKNTDTVYITGSLQITGGITGSIESSSYASTASYVETAQTASYVLNAISSSYADSVQFDNVTEKPTLVSASSQIDHASTTNLDYASSGHTGFAGTGVVNTFTQNQTITGSLFVSGNINNDGYEISASSFSGSFYGDGSNVTGVISSSYAITASYAENAGQGVGYWTGSGADITRESDVYITGSLFVSGTIDNVGYEISASSFSGSFYGDGSNITGIVSSSYAVTASYADFAANIDNLLTGSYSTQSFSNVATWSFNHNLESEYVGIYTYDSSDEQIIPTKTKLVNNNTVDIYFTIPQTGVALATLGTGTVTVVSGSGGSGGLYRTGIESVNSGSISITFSSNLSSPTYSLWFSIQTNDATSFIPSDPVSQVSKSISGFTVDNVAESGSLQYIAMELL